MQYIQILRGAPKSVRDGSRLNKKHADHLGRSGTRRRTARLLYNNKKEDNGQPGPPPSRFSAPMASEFASRRVWRPQLSSAARPGNPTAAAQRAAASTTSISPSAEQKGANRQALLDH